jgi:hypothetical protein
MTTPAESPGEQPVAAVPMGFKVIVDVHPNQPRTVTATLEPAVGDQPGRVTVTITPPEE